MNRVDKIQCLLIKHLIEEGSITLTLPDGIILDVGITQDSKKGKIKADNYCWVEASRQDKTISIDSYNTMIKCKNQDSDKGTFLWEDEISNDIGEFTTYDLI